MARRCTNYQVAGRGRRNATSDILLTFCVWPFHLMGNTWWDVLTPPLPCLWETASPESCKNIVSRLLRPLETWTNSSWFGRETLVNICIHLQDIKLLCRYVSLCSFRFLPFKVQLICSFCLLSGSVIQEGNSRFVQCFSRSLSQSVERGWERLCRNPVSVYLNQTIPFLLRFIFLRMLCVCGKEDNLHLYQLL